MVAKVFYVFVAHCYAVARVFGVVFRVSCSRYGFLSVFSMLLLGLGIFGHLTIRFRFWESRSDSRTILDLLFFPLIN